MDAYRLHKDEILYELRIRELSTAGTMDDLRKRLYRALGNNVLPEDRFVLTLDAYNELKICAEKADSLRREVEETDEDSDLPELKRLDSRLTHLYYRLARLSCDDDDEDKRAPLLEAVKLLRDHLGACMRKHKSTPGALRPEPIPLSEELGDAGIQAWADDRQNPRPDGLNRGIAPDKPQGAIPKVKPTLPPPNPGQAIGDGPRDNQEDEEAVLARRMEQILGNAIRNIALSSSNARDRRASEPRQEYRDLKLDQWGLKFSGDSADKLTLSKFLEDVEQRRIAKRISKMDLFESFGELLDGSAQIWYRANRQRFDTWEELIMGLRKCFLEHDFDDKLLEEIRKRTQGTNESPEIYFAKMKCLFNRLSYPLSEREKLRIVEKNLKPEHLPFVPNFQYSTLDQLEQALTNLELWTRRAQNYHEPPTRGLLEPDLAFLGRKSQIAQTQKTAPVETKPRQLVCWNCKAVGHAYPKCTLALGDFCRVCGKDGVKPEACTRYPKCPGNEAGKSS